MGQNRDIAHQRDSGMGEIVEGVIRGKTIELEVDPGLQDGGVVEVVIRRVKQPRTWGGYSYFISWTSVTPQSKRENQPCLLHGIAGKARSGRDGLPRQRAAGRPWPCLRVLMYSARNGPIEHMAEEAALNRSGASRHDRRIATVAPAVKKTAPGLLSVPTR